MKKKQMEAIIMKYLAFICKRIVIMILKLFTQIFEQVKFQNLMKLMNLVIEKKSAFRVFISTDLNKVGREKKPRFGKT